MFFPQSSSDEDQFNTRMTLMFWVVFYPSLAIVLYHFLLKPYFLIRFYKKQGATGKYLPGLNFPLSRSQDAYEHRDYMHYFKNTIKTDPKTKVFVTNQGSQCVLYLANSDLVKEFQKTQKENYTKTGYKVDLVRLFLGESILIGEGSRWKTQKKLLLNCFHSDKLRDATPIVSKVAYEMYEKISKRNLENLNLFKENDKISSETFGVFFFGERFLKHKFEGESLGVGLSLLLNLAFSELNSGSWDVLLRNFFMQPGFSPRHRHILKRIHAFRQICKTMIADKKKSIEDNKKEESILQILVDQQKFSPEDCLTDEEIIDLFLNLFFAGTDNVANLVTMASYYLTKNPEVCKKLKTEVYQVFGESKEIKAQNVQKMDYTLAVLKETLMKTNPDAFSIPRIAINDHKLGNLLVKKDTVVIFSPLLQNYNDKNDVLSVEFNPERWIGCKSPLWKEDNSGFNAFSTGPHSCVGQNFAMMQAKIMLGLFVRKFKMELVEDSELKMTYKTIYKPLTPIKMNLNVY